METSQGLSKEQRCELDWPPDIDYEELARKAGYSEEEIEKMFQSPYIKQYKRINDEPSPLDPIFNTDLPF